jgi:hypothetical protein
MRSSLLWLVACGGLVVFFLGGVSTVLQVGDGGRCGGGARGSAGASLFFLLFVGTFLLFLQDSCVSGCF